MMPNTITITREQFKTAFAEALHAANGCPMPLCREIADRHAATMFGAMRADIA